MKELPGGVYEWLTNYYKPLGNRTNRTDGTFSTILGTSDAFQSHNGLEFQSYVEDICGMLLKYLDYFFLSFFLPSYSSTLSAQIKLSINTIHDDVIFPQLISSVPGLFFPHLKALTQ